MATSEGMDRHGVFWVNIWRTVGALVAALALVIAVFNHYDNERFHQRWIKCVENGGQPMSQPVVGSESLTFTCVRK